MQLHRLGTFLLMLALAGGLSVQNARAADIHCDMVMTSVDEMSMMGGCGVGDDGAAQAMDCLMPCINGTAVLPNSRAAEAIISSATARFQTSTLAGRYIRPEPHPPRPDLLS